MDNVRFDEKGMYKIYTPGIPLTWSGVRDAEKTVNYVIEEEGLTMNENVGNEVDRRVREYCERRGWDIIAQYSDAMKTVLNSDLELKRQYAGTQDEARQYSDEQKQNVRDEIHRVILRYKDNHGIDDYSEAMHQLFSERPEIKKMYAES